MSPLAWTGIGLACGLIAAFLVAHGLLLSGLVLFLLGRVLDGVDGAVARHRERVTALGGYLDLMADFMVYAAIPLALAYALPGLIWTSLILMAAFYVNAASWMLLSARLEADKTTFAMPKGLIEGGESILFYTLFLVLPEYAAFLMWAMAAMTVFTILQRLLFAIKHL